MSRHTAKTRRDSYIESCNRAGAPTPTDDEIEAITGYVSFRKRLKGWLVAIVIGLSMGLVAMFNSGCAASSSIYGPDGRPAYSINCSGAFLTWGECFKKAGSICNTSGYDTISVNGQNAGSVVTANPTTGVFATPVIERIMVVSCKGPDPAQDD